MENAWAFFDHILGTTNTILGIITSIISILGAVGVVAVKSGDSGVSGAGGADGCSFVFQVISGTFIAVFTTVFGTVVFDVLINGGITAFIASQHHLFVPPDFTNTTVFLISAIFGIWFGISAAWYHLNNPR